MENNIKYIRGGFYIRPIKLPINKHKGIGVRVLF